MAGRCYAPGAPLLYRTEADSATVEAKTWTGWSMNTPPPQMPDSIRYYIFIYRADLDAPIHLIEPLFTITPSTAVANVWWFLQFVTNQYLKLLAMLVALYTRTSLAAF